MQEMHENGENGELYTSITLFYTFVFLFIKIVCFFFHFFGKLGCCCSENVSSSWFLPVIYPHP